ncbi:MAG: SPOR domain-containing protein [Vicinamibacteria bacterium]|nr:SPOR domain-containing protein [Vicinamibacteria bacterium]
MTQQDDYYYEIQLTNKQLVFYFLAGATGLVLAFLAGVMVGRGVQAPPDPMAAQPVREEKIVTEEPKATPLPADALTYAKNLESDRAEDVLEKPAPAARPSAAATPQPTAPPAPPTTAAARPTPAPKATPKPTPAPAKAAPAAPAASGAFTIQVGAFRDRASADSIAARLKGKGFAAFVVAPTGEGLFNVRVGSYAARPEAERVMARLRDQEKFKPFIVKN